MSEQNHVNGAGGLWLPFVLLAAGCAIGLFTLSRDSRLVNQSLQNQIAAAGAQQQQANARLQQAGQQGQQVGAAQQHYFALYGDLVELAKTDAQAAEIVKKYGISVTAPAAQQK